MDLYVKQRLQENRVPLVNDLEPKEVVDHLVEGGVFSENDSELVTNQLTRKERCRLLLHLLNNRGPHAFQVFLRALRDKNYNHLEELLNKGDPELPQSTITGGSGCVPESKGDNHTACGNCGLIYPLNPNCDPRLRHAVRKLCCLLCRNVEPRDLLDVHIQGKVLGEHEYEAICTKGTRQDRFITFIGELCRRNVGPHNTYDIFKESLRKKYKFILDAVEEVELTFDPKSEVADLCSSSLVVSKNDQKESLGDGKNLSHITTLGHGESLQFNPGPSLSTIGLENENNKTSAKSECETLSSSVNIAADVSQSKHCTKVKEILGTQSDSLEPLDIQTRPHHNYTLLSEADVDLRQNDCRDCCADAESLFLESADPLSELILSKTGNNSVGQSETGKMSSGEKQLCLLSENKELTDLGDQSLVSAMCKNSSKGKHTVHKKRKHRAGSHYLLLCERSVSSDEESCVISLATRGQDGSSQNPECTVLLKAVSPEGRCDGTFCNWRKIAINSPDIKCTLQCRPTSANPLGLSGKKVELAFNYMSKLINTGQFDKFEQVSKAVMNKFQDNPDMNCVVRYLSASRDLFRTDFESAKKHIDKAYAVLPKTSNPKYFTLELYTVKTRMYVTQKRLDKLENVLTDAKMMIEADPVGCTGRAAGWLFMNDARNKTAQISTLNPTSPNFKRAYENLHKTAKKSFERAMTNFQQDIGADGPFGFGYALCRLVILLMRCGDNGLMMDILEPPTEDIVIAMRYLRHLEDSDVAIPKILNMHFLIAKTDLQFRKKNNTRALEHAQVAFDLASELNLMEFIEHTRNRLHRLQQTQKIDIQDVTDEEASMILLQDTGSSGPDDAWLSDT